MTKHNTQKTSALKKARKLFQRNDISDTESSDYSVESQENSHIPLHEEIPSIASLFIEKDENMEQITAQLQQISTQLQNLTTKQVQYEQQLNAIRCEVPPFNESDDDEEEERLVNLGPANAQNVMESLSRIPDPIKSIPTFDGNSRQLNAWVTSAENTLQIFKPLVPTNVFTIYEQAVIHKLQGKAKDAICMAQYPLTFADAKEVLITTLGDRQELSSYKSKLWKNKQGDSMSVHKYYQRTQYLVENIKFLAKQDKDFAKSWPAISKFIDQDALAAFISGLNEFYFGHALAARPKTLEDAYAFLCEYTSSERIARGERRVDSNVPRNNKNDNHKNHKYTTHNNPMNTEKRESEPMEVDGSIRSKLTLNRRQIHNHETNHTQPEQEDDNEDDENEDEELDLNFQIASSDRRPT